MLIRVVLPIIRTTCFDQPYITDSNESRVFIRYGDDFFKNADSDELTYVLTAKSLIEGHGYAVNIQEFEKYDNSSPELGQINSKHVFTGRAHKKELYKGDFFKHKLVPPLYPIFLALCIYAFGLNTLAWFLPQILLSSLTCCLIYSIAKGIFNDKVAVASAFMVALYPELILWTNKMRVETLFIFLLTLSFWFLLKKDSNQKKTFALLIGVFLGMACLTRLTLLFFVPLIIVWKLFCWEQEKRSIVLWLLVLLFSFAIILSAWAIRNAVVFNDFTVLTDEAGAIFVDYPNSHIYPIIMSNSSSLPYLTTFVGFVARNPKEFIIKSSIRFIKYLSPFTSQMQPQAKIYKTLTWLFIFPASFCGMFLALKKQWQASGLLIAFIVYYIIFHGFTVVDDGLVYRYPIQPFLCIFAAYGYYLIFNKFRERLE